MLRENQGNNTSKSELAGIEKMAQEFKTAIEGKLRLGMQISVEDFKAKVSDFVRQSLKEVLGDASSVRVIISETPDRAEDGLRFCGTVSLDGRRIFEYFRLSPRHQGGESELKGIYWKDTQFQMFKKHKIKELPPDVSNAVVDALSQIIMGNKAK